jgi:glycerol uptake facilitator protein
MIFAPVTPNPGLIGIGPASVAAKLHVPDGWSQVALWQGFVGEFVATAMLVIFILVMLERRNTFGPAAWYFPVALGLAVMMLVVFEGGPSMVSLNAARDFGPRLFMWFTGWGKIAFPGPRGDWWVTTIGPTCGALAGGAFFDFVMLSWFPKQGEEAPPGRHEEAPFVEHID